MSDVDLSLGELTRTSVSRSRRWHPGFPDDTDWSGADWANALNGEAGEFGEVVDLLITAKLTIRLMAMVGKAGNTVKKLRRHETGALGVLDVDLDVLMAQLAEELADVQCYLVLVAVKYGIDLPAAVIAKFNDVSERQGFPERLAGHPVPATAAKLSLLCAALDQFDADLAARKHYAVAAGDFVDRARALLEGATS